MIDPRRLDLTILVGAVLGSGLLADNVSWQQMPGFRSGVEIVVLDVSVLGPDRQPIRGLTAADFTVLEDGNPQVITTFTAVDLPEAHSEGGPSWTRSVAPDVSRNDDLPKEGRLISIVLDDATPMNADEIARVKNAGRKIVQEMGAADVAAVVFALDKRGGQEFTRDRQRLLAAIDRFNGGLLFGSNAKYDVFNPDALTLYYQALGVVEGVAEYLAALPQRRKALFYLSVGVPIDIERAVPRRDLGNGDDSGAMTRDLGRTFFRLCRAAARANVAVYAIDPGGFRLAAGTANQRFLASLGANTGGFAVLNQNEPTPEIRQAFRENSSYYLLGYQPTDRRAEGRFRKISVRVNRAEVTVRTRTGYYEPDPRHAVSPVPAASPLERAIRSPLPQNDLSLQATAAPFRTAVTGKTALAIVLGVRSPAALAPPTSSAERAGAFKYNFDVLIGAYDAESGRPGGSERLTVDATLKPDARGQVTYEVLSRLDVKPGRYQLRIAAENQMTHVAGSVYHDVVVPDFSKGLSLSGLLLSTASGPAASRRDALVSLVPVTPTTRREFDADDEVVAFVRIYEPADRVMPVTLTVRVVDEADTTVAEKRSVIERLSPDHSADCRFEVPLRGLSPGAYLLTVEAAASRWTARRDVRFSVR